MYVLAIVYKSKTNMDLKNVILIWNNWLRIPVSATVNNLFIINKKIGKIVSCSVFILYAVIILWKKIIFIIEKYIWLSI